MATPEHELMGNSAGEAAENSADKNAPDGAEKKDVADAEWPVASERSAGKEGNTPESA